MALTDVGEASGLIKQTPIIRQPVVGIVSDRIHVELPFPVEDVVDEGRGVAEDIILAVPRRETTRRMRGSLTRSYKSIGELK